MASTTPGPRARKRDPNRRQSILDAAALLLARRGYVGVSMADIGAEVGVAASALYWHFPSKQQLLVSLFDQCMDRLVSEQREILMRSGHTLEALQEIVARQVDFVVDERGFAQVYYREATSLAPDDLRRLRGKQRAYVDGLVELVCDLRPEVEHATVAALVHAAIGTVQSTLQYRSHMDDEELKTFLVGLALRTLSTTA
ncbi:AcrR family transcriptional regulator [Nocardioides sp. BE266]|uniref:TetR/AcrR family transcriptional regulator n=1 Tax=Nocardioides sp. BE266 TaxID=2817725 RepID=UPI0028581DFA|nr:TetR/AcrR family transcriptional regulator [Nocardioides sp. BE266]MDR7254286.1 AcrR family transcriptional regulator [Nocardioides sp. BE266]